MIGATLAMMVAMLAADPMKRTDDDLMPVLTHVALSVTDLRPFVEAGNRGHRQATGITEDGNLYTLGESAPPRVRLANIYFEFHKLLPIIRLHRRRTGLKLKRRLAIKRKERLLALQSDLLWLQTAIALHLGDLQQAATSQKFLKRITSPDQSFTAKDLLDLAMRLLRLLQGNVLQYTIFRSDLLSKISNMNDFPVIVAAAAEKATRQNQVPGAHEQEMSTLMAADIVCRLFREANLLDQASVWPIWSSQRFTEMVLAGMLWQAASVGLDCFADKIFDMGLRKHGLAAYNRISLNKPLEIAGYTGRHKLAQAGHSGDESLKLSALATAATYAYTSVLRSILDHGVCVDRKTYMAVLSHTEIVFQTSMPVLIDLGRPCPGLSTPWTMVEAHRRRKKLSFTEEKSSNCDIPVIDNDQDLSTSRFLKEFVYAGKPVIVRGALQHKRFSHIVAGLSSPQALLELGWGSHNFSSSIIPYADLFNFGCNGDTCVGDPKKGGTLHDYLANASSITTEESNSVPHYIFSPCSDYQRTLFTKSLPHFLEPYGSTKPIRINLCEFYVGPAGSGSPVHWHVSALNFLISGSKRWFLAPPGHSFHSRIPAKLWWHGHSRKALKYRQTKVYLECTQLSGDVMLVPRFWAHSVLNMGETNIGYAFEFNSLITRPTVKEPERVDRPK